jgi:hypothetical protein
MVRRTLINTSIKRRISMLYSVSFKKSNTSWWDEDSYGSMLFFAGSDTEARRFVETILQIINRSYEKIKEPRNVQVSSLSQVHVRGQFGTKSVAVPKMIFIEAMRYKRLSDLRDVYRALFPSKLETGIWTRNCSLLMFYDYKPEARYKKMKPKTPTRDTSLGTWVSY